MIGVDLTSIDRFRKIKKNDYMKWQKFFSEREWNYAFELAEPAAHLAGIFAAKEAVMKAIGGDYIKRFDLINIDHLKSGKPIATLGSFGKVTKKGQRKGPKVEISISHEKNIAVAVAIVI